MTLSSGTRLGPYEIVNAIGAGGMGEVYRAHDARLHRDVAIKLLPRALGSVQPLVWKASISDGELKNFYLNLQRAGDLLSPLATGLQHAQSTQLKQSPRKY